MRITLPRTIVVTGNKRPSSAWVLTLWTRAVSYLSRLFSRGNHAVLDLATAAIVLRSPPKCRWLAGAAHIDFAPGQAYYTTETRMPAEA